MGRWCWCLQLCAVVGGGRGCVSRSDFPLFRVNYCNFNTVYDHTSCGRGNYLYAEIFHIFGTFAGDLALSLALGMPGAHLRIAIV